MKKRTPYGIQRLGGKIKAFGSVDTARRVGSDNRLDNEQHWAFVHVYGNEVLLTAGGIEHLTPDRAVDLARRLLNAAEFASNVNVGDP